MVVKEAVGTTAAEWGSYSCWSTLSTVGGAYMTAADGPSSDIRSRRRSNQALRHSRWKQRHQGRGWRPVTDSPGERGRHTAVAALARPINMDWQGL